MFRNYLVIAFRNLLRQKGFSAINIIGLSAGMACSILILLWVRHEVSYNRFNEKVGPDIPPGTNATLCFRAADHTMHARTYCQRPAERYP